MRSWYFKQNLLRVMYSGSQVALAKQFLMLREGTCWRQRACSMLHSDRNCCTGERHQLRTKLGIESEEDLKAQFAAFANFGNHGEQWSEMDGSRFAKYCAECKVLGGGVTRTDVDLAFTRVKDKGARRISFDQFLKALHVLAERRGATLPELLQRCLRFEGPVNHSSVRVGNVRLHDDKVRVARAPHAVYAGSHMFITTASPHERRTAQRHSSPRTACRAHTLACTLEAAQRVSTGRTICLRSPTANLRTTAELKSRRCTRTLQQPRRAGLARTRPQLLPRASAAAMAGRALSAVARL
jgi:p25-alpha